MLISKVSRLDGRKVRSFSLSSGFLEPYKTKEVKWGPVGYFTFKRTYARDKVDGTTEEWWEACQRVVEGVFTHQKIYCRNRGLYWNESKAQRTAQLMYDAMFNFKWLPPGRGIRNMGADVVFEKGSACLQNCGFASTENIDMDFSGPFTFLMDMSMLGVGVGGDTKGAGKVKIVMPKLDGTYVVEDTREGWVDLARTILLSFVGKGQLPVEVDVSGVRTKGAPIDGLGGVASGPAPLKELAVKLVELLTPPRFKVTYTGLDEELEPIKFTFVEQDDGEESYKITSTIIVDIFNLIGACVVSGGIRRTAEIMFGEIGDGEFLKLKDPSDLNAWGAEKTLLEGQLKGLKPDLDALGEKLFDGSAPDEKDQLLMAAAAEARARIASLGESIENHPLRTHRWASNNSVMAEVGMDYTEIGKMIAMNGEPGLIWLDNMQQYSRMGDPPDGKDRRAKGSNPCVEQTLEDRELCCLVENFPANCDSFEDFKTTLKCSYLYAKTVTLIATHDPRANEVMIRNGRIGCSLSGIQQARKKLGHGAFREWTKKGYDYVQELDNIYSDWLGVRRSIKTTSVKPSGTVSLLCGATPGIHYPLSQYYIRNIRVADTSPLIQACVDAGYKVEPDVYASDTMVVSFPVEETNFHKAATEASIWEQFQMAAEMQRYWADNQVSATIYFHEEEAGDIPNCLAMYDSHLKGISILPHKHGYAQAPIMPITEEEYIDLSMRLKPLSLSGSTHEVDDKYCDGDKCELPWAS